jgi:hypothetical protein
MQARQAAAAKAPLRKIDSGQSAVRIHIINDSYLRYAADRFAFKVRLFAPIMGAGAANHVTSLVGDLISAKKTEKSYLQVT